MVANAIKTQNLDFRLAIAPTESTDAPDAEYWIGLFYNQALERLLKFSDLNIDSMQSLLTNPEYERLRSKIHADMEIVVPRLLAAYPESISQVRLTYFSGNPREILSDPSKEVSIISPEFSSGTLEQDVMNRIRYDTKIYQNQHKIVIKRGASGKSHRIENEAKVYLDHEKTLPGLDAARVLFNRGDIIVLTHYLGYQLQDFVDHFRNDDLYEEYRGGGEKNRVNYVIRNHQNKDSQSQKFIRNSAINGVLLALGKIEANPVTGLVPETEDMVKNFVSDIDTVAKYFGMKLPFDTHKFAEEYCRIFKIDSFSTDIVSRQMTIDAEEIFQKLKPYQAEFFAYLPEDNYLVELFNAQYGRKYQEFKGIECLVNIALENNRPDLLNHIKYAIATSIHPYDYDKFGISSTFAINTSRIVSDRAFNLVANGLANLERIFHASTLYKQWAINGNPSQEEMIISAVDKYIQTDKPIKHTGIRAKIIEEFNLPEMETGRAYQSIMHLLYMSVFEMAAAIRRGAPQLENLADTHEFDNPYTNKIPLYRLEQLRSFTLIANSAYQFAQIVGNDNLQELNLFGDLLGEMAEHLGYKLSRESQEFRNANVRHWVYGSLQSLSCLASSQGGTSEAFKDLWFYVHTLHMAKEKDSEVAEFVRLGELQYGFRRIEELFTDYLSNQPQIPFRQYLKGAIIPVIPREYSSLKRFMTLTEDQIIREYLDPKIPVGKRAGQYDYHILHPNEKLAPQIRAAFQSEGYTIP